MDATSLGLPKPELTDGGTTTTERQAYKDAWDAQIETADANILSAIGTGGGDIAYAALADGDHVGPTTPGVAGEDLTGKEGYTGYIKAADGRVYLTACDAAGTMSNHPVLIAAGATTGAAIDLLEPGGYMRLDALGFNAATYGSAVKGTEIYVNTVPGSKGLMSLDAPSTAGYLLQPAGKVTEVENIFQWFPDQTIVEIGVETVDLSSVQTLTNKRITKRVGQTASAAEPTIDTDDYDAYELTGQTEAITSFTTNLSGTPVNGDLFRVAITGTATRAITWGAKFEASTVALPTTTDSTNRLDVGFIYNGATSKWRCVAVA